LALGTQYLSLGFGVPPEDVAASFELEVPRRYEDDVSYFDPDTSLHLAPDSAYSLVSVCAPDEESIVAQHLGDRTVQLTFPRGYHLTQLAFTEDFLLAQRLTLEASRLVYSEVALKSRGGDSVHHMRGAREVTLILVPSLFLRALSDYDMSTQ
jgi:hypothetical protein